MTFSKDPASGPFLLYENPIGTFCQFIYQSDITKTTEMFRPINLRYTLILSFLLLGYCSTYAQEHLQLPHGLVKLYADDFESGTFIPPPEGFVYGEDRAVTFNVSYTGFTPEAQTAFQYAVDIWASLLTSSVVIDVDANFSSLEPGILGSAGPEGLFRDFVGAPLAGTWYPTALIGSLTGSDIEPGVADIGANFSNSFGFYFGTDGNPGPGEYDFVSVVLHELGHGLGFLSVTAIEDGLGYNLLGGFPYVYDHFVENGAGTSVLAFDDGTSTLATQLTSDDMFFDGPNSSAANGGNPVPLYSPATWNAGSSMSHLNDDDYPAGNPNSLMTHSIGPTEAIHSPGDIGLGIMQDMGWNQDNGCLLWHLPIDYNTSISEPAVLACEAPTGYVLADNQLCAAQVATNDGFCGNTD
jgi:hypothetical protein